jgi:hypothetical protein
VRTNLRERTQTYRYEDHFEEAKGELRRRDDGLGDVPGHLDGEDRLVR